MVSVRQTGGLTAIFGHNGHTVVPGAVTAAVLGRPDWLPGLISRYHLTPRPSA